MLAYGRAHIQVVANSPPYHADIIAIEQNLGQFGVRSRVVARDDLSVNLGVQ